jgi:hypothetical protein
MYLADPCLTCLHVDSLSTTPYPPAAQSTSMARNLIMSSSKMKTKGSALSPARSKASSSKDGHVDSTIEPMVPYSPQSTRIKGVVSTLLSIKHSVVDTAYFDDTVGIAAKMLIAYDEGLTSCEQDPAMSTVGYAFAMTAHQQAEAKTTELKKQSVASEKNYKKARKTRLKLK